MIHTSHAPALLAIAALAAGSVHAANPILPGYADPALRVRGERLYLVVGKDESPANKDFFMTRWELYSTTDLVDWRREAVIDPADTYLGAGYRFCWAADIGFREDGAYLYISEHSKATAVLRADTPAGPYKDVLGRPLADGKTSANANYDPTFFTDVDGQSYLIMGRDGILPSTGKLVHYQIAKLRPDWLGLAEPLRDMLTDRPYGFGNAKNAADHSYFHRHGDLYYLSRDTAYMTSRSIYGPYENLRELGPGKGHASFADYRGQSFKAYEYTDERHGNRMYRQVMLTYLHYRDNGDMREEVFFLKDRPGYAYGVGEYDAGWTRVEAEWFLAGDGVRKRDNGEGYAVHALRDGATLLFPKVRNLPAAPALTLRLAASKAGGSITIRRGSADGAILGRCAVPATGDTAKFETVRVALAGVGGAGAEDLCLVFEGAAEARTVLDWWSVEPAPAQAAVAVPAK